MEVYGYPPVFPDESGFSSVTVNKEDELLKDKSKGKKVISQFFFIDVSECNFFFQFYILIFTLFIINQILFMFVE